jgi:CRISPR-associated endonuclease/helicase Cas3
MLVNTVDNARKIFERLSRVHNAKATLLIGRVRPIDRDKVLAEWLPRIKTGRDRIDDQPIFVVATQTIEVGADIDLDALVTEAAPLDVLRQRFGRLDRLGELRTTAAVVLRTPDEFRAYGDATGKTWTWLGKRSRSRNGEKTIDFGVLAMDDCLKKHPVDGAFSPASHAPPFLPAYLEAWCQTAAIPDADPAVAPFLHGPDAFDVDEVQVVWRADLEDKWLDAVMVAPPSIREAMAVPIWAVRNWLGSRPVLLWCGLDSTRTGIIPVKAIRPGDTVVVPSEYGGADDFGWHSDSKKPVRDIGDEASKWVRLHPAFLVGENAARLARIMRSEELDTDAVARLTKQLGIGDINVANARKYGSGIILFRKRQLMAEGDAGSVTSVQVPLSLHLDGVEQHARQFASKCRLEIDEIEAIALAARLHDMGKLDPRFQAILHGGDLLEAYFAPGVHFGSGSGSPLRVRTRHGVRSAALPSGRDACGFTDITGQSAQVTLAVAPARSEALANPTTTRQNLKATGLTTRVVARVITGPRCITSRESLGVGPTSPISGLCGRPPSAFSWLL